MHLMKILLVEDDKLLNHHLTTLLTEAQNQVHSTDSAQVALHYAADYPIDVGIIDLGLPDMDGIDVLRELRSWSSLPVVVVSARSHEHDKVQALDLGADDYLTKPFGTAELLARVRTAMTTSSRLQLPARSPKPLMVHSIWRAPPILTPASELATAMPRSLWQCTDQIALSEFGIRWRRFLMKFPYSSGMA